MVIKLLLLGGSLPALCLAASTPAGGSAPAEPLPEVPLSNIRLLDSPFKQRQDVHRGVLLGYDVERLLHNFRVNAGLPSRAEPYGGWEAPGCGLRGHFTGHYLSACAMMFAATGAPEFRGRVAQLVDGLADCQRALGTGYLSAFPVSEFEKLETRFFDGVWAPYYTIHKIMTGLLDAHEHAGNLRAREMAVAMAGYFAARLERLSPEAREKMTLTNYKGNPVNEYGGIAESFLSVYRLTQDARQPFDATLRFRRPGWLAGPAELRINGAAVPARDLSRDGSWLVLDRAWQPDTRIELRLPMNIRVRPAMDNPALVSFFHGPVLLGGALGREAMPESDIVTSQTVYHKLPPIEAPALQSVSVEALKPVPGRPLTYTTPAAHGRPITLMPFYQLHHQRYSLYWRAAPQPAPSPVKDAPTTAGFPPAGSTRKAGAPLVNATASPAHGPLDWARLRNPVWTSADNLRDPSVLKTPNGYLLFYSRLAGTNWASPAGWSIASVFTRDFIRFEGDRDISPKGYASPGDVVKWHGRYLLPYQSYPATPTQLCFSESPDLQAWSAPKPFLTEARFLRWNTLQRVIDPTLVLEGERLHCYFVGSANVTNAAGKILRANLLSHALTRDPKLKEWEILSTHEPLLGVSERAPDGVENVMVFRTGDLWTMIYSEGLASQHLALATSADLGAWKTEGPIELPRQKWMARKYGAPFVWREADQWLMILMGENATGKTTFGLLTSPDGSHWTPRPE